MENINSWLTIPNDLSLTIKLKNFYSISTQNIPVSGTKCQVSRSVWGTGHSLIQQPPEITGTCWALSLEMRIECHTKVSLFWLRKREQFSVVLFAFLETRREFYWRRNVTRDCFWDCYWGRAGQLSAIFLSVPSNNPRSLCESYWPIFPLLFLITIPEVFAKVNSTRFPTCS